MAEAEKRERGKYWRARWRGPDGRRESQPGSTDNLGLN
jgi:hypothetical protein